VDIKKINQTRKKLVEFMNKMNQASKKKKKAKK